MARWLPVDPQQFDVPQTLRSGGVDLNVFVSPQDLPDAVSGEYDAALDRFVIGFRYVTQDEPLVADDGDAPIRFCVGQNSRRLYRIEIDVKVLKAQAVSLTVLPARVTEAIDHLSTRAPQRGRDRNYKVARQVIKEKGGDLFRPLQPA